MTDATSMTSVRRVAGTVSMLGILLTACESRSGELVIIPIQIPDKQPHALSFAFVANQGTSIDKARLHVRVTTRGVQLEPDGGGDCEPLGADGGAGSACCYPMHESGPALTLYAVGGTIESTARVRGELFEGACGGAFIDDQIWPSLMVAPVPPRTADAAPAADDAARKDAASDAATIDGGAP